MRPIDLPAADRFKHGTRARYVTGCRCENCRQANRDWAHKRVLKVRAAAEEVKPNGPPVEKIQVKRDRWGRTRSFTFKYCPGGNGQPCVRGGTWLRMGGGICTPCIDREAVWSGLVPSDRARRHLKKLSAAAVGYKAVGAASDVATSSLSDILSGSLAQIRASTERRILAVDAGAIADSALVPIGPTLSLIRRLLAEGFTRKALAQRIFGQNGSGPALSLLYGKRKNVLASTAAKVERFCRLLDAEGEETPEDAVDPEHLEIIRELRAGERTIDEIAEGHARSRRTIERVKSKYQVRSRAEMEVA